MPNLQAYYPFDDDTAADMSGNNRDGTWDQGTETYGEGIMGRAASFDGSSRIVVDAFANFAWGDQFTISLWFNRAGCDGNYQGIANGGGYHAEGSWEIRMGREGGCTSVGGGVVTASHGATWDHLGVSQGGTVPAAATDEWHHAVCTYDGSQVNFYLDRDAPAASSQDSGDLLVDPDGVYIGQAGPPRGNEYFTGLVDEVMIYTQAATAADVEDLFAGASGGR